MSISNFASLPCQPPDPIFELVDLCAKDVNPNKINLAIGSYRDDNGKPYVLDVVKKAKSRILNDPNANHEYNPMTGIDSYTQNAAKVILGEDSPAIKDNRVNIYKILKI